MSGFDNFRKELSAGMSAPVYLLISGDTFFFREAILSLSEQFQTVVFDPEDKESPGTLSMALDALNTRSLFGDKRCVVVKNAQSALKDSLPSIDNYAENPNPGSILVLFYAAESASSFKTKKPMPRFHPKVKPIHLDLRKADLPGWIEKLSARYGFKFSGGASSDVVQFLAEAYGGNLFALDNEIKKLSLMGKKTISMEEVNEVSYGAIQYSPFSLTDALNDVSPKRAIERYESLAGSTDEFMLLGAVNNNLSRMNLSPDITLKCYEFLVDTDLRMRIAGVGNFPHELTIVGLHSILKKKKSHAGKPVRKAGT